MEDNKPAQIWRKWIEMAVGFNGLDILVRHPCLFLKSRLRPDPQTSPSDFSLNRHGIIEGFPAAVLGDSRELALLFKDLATLRSDARLFRDVDELRWRGPTEAFTACAEHLGEVRLLERSLKAQKITQMTDLRR
jgi:hypothetical protein